MDNMDNKNNMSFSMYVDNNKSELLPKKSTIMDR